MGSLSADKAGVGSAVNDTTGELGGTLGVAIISSVFRSLYVGSLKAGSERAAPRLCVPAATRAIVRSLTVSMSAGVVAPAATMVVFEEQHLAVVVGADAQECRFVAGEQSDRLGCDRAEDDVGGIGRGQPVDSSNRIGGVPLQL